MRSHSAELERALSRKQEKFYNQPGISRVELTVHTAFQQPTKQKPTPTLLHAGGRAACNRVGVGFCLAGCWNAVCTVRSPALICPTGRLPVSAKSILNLGTGSICDAHKCWDMIGSANLSMHPELAQAICADVVTNSKETQLPLQYNCTVSAVRPKFAAALRSRPPLLCLAPLVQGQRRGSSPSGLSHGRRPVRSLGGAPPARAQPTDRPCETTNGEDGSHGRT